MDKLTWQGEAHRASSLDKELVNAGGGVGHNGLLQGRVPQTSWLSNTRLSVLRAYTYK